MSKDKKIIFLDRDGVINKDPGGWTEHSYVTRWEDFHFLPGSIEAIKKLNKHGYEIIVISNQGGISKGFYAESKLKEINKKMLEKIEKSGGKIKKAYYCVHQASDECDCKKPKIGLFKKAEKELSITTSDTYFVGDGKMDIEAAQKIGLKSVLVLSGKTNLENTRNWDIKPDYIFDDLKETVNFIIERGT